ncbi:MAG: putative toxin-antitoxin system toxin component, PIN family [Firmicutes bacterium]|nr:putative toxin-antitoxin system toxin component, PIN family [Bacillota bacterium]
MRVVLDTNVLVSGLISAEGPCGQILRLMTEDVLQPCLDERILAEYEAVLSRPELQIDPEDIAGTIEIIHESGEFLTPLPSPMELPDATDMPFLEVAASGEAVLITGNARHFPARARAGVRVMTPREFLDLLRGAS